MTEAEWLAATDPTPMLEFLRDRASERKLRLFAVRCCRYFFCDPHGGDDYAEKEILSPVASVADGILYETNLRVIGQTAADLDDYTEYALYKRDSLIAAAGSPFEIRYVWEGLEAFTNSQNCYPGELYQIGRATLIELFGNPFRPVIVNPSWLTSDVLTLAEGIYHERAFDRLPILADALQDAGCDNEDILNHCRQPGEHVRGCWVVDLLLGKS